MTVKKVDKLEKVKALEKNIEYASLLTFVSLLSVAIGHGVSDLQCGAIVLALLSIYMPMVGICYKLRSAIE